MEAVDTLNPEIERLLAAKEARRRRLAGDCAWNRLCWECADCECDRARAGRTAWRSCNSPSSFPQRKHAIDHLAGDPKIVRGIDQLGQLIARHVLGDLLVFREQIDQRPAGFHHLPADVVDEIVGVLPAELRAETRTLYAQAGFNVIGTANTRDRGVNEMSAALKRRFNFETVHPIVSGARGYWQEALLTPVPDAVQRVAMHR